MGLIYLVRHGETDWNRDERFRGREDLVLNERGLKQAEAIARFFEFRKISAIYSSPLKRARQTAEIIARKKRLSVQIDNGFLDVDYGRWQGLKLEEIEEKFPSTFQQWLENPLEVTFPDGDSVRAVSERAAEALLNLANKHQEEEIVVVAHQAINKIILYHFFHLKKRLWEIPQDVAAINLLIFNEKKLKIGFYNYNEHLAEKLI